MPSYFCRCVHGLRVGQGRTRDHGLLSLVCSERRFLQSGAIPNSAPLFLLRGGEKKSLSPACFVVSLKRDAAVSIKRHRSKETPPTEIPTEEGEEEEEEEGSGRLTDINIKDRL